MKVGAVTEDIPAATVREIGRVITRWANLHSHARRAAYTLMGLDPKIGRLWIREPKLAEHISMIEATIRYRELAVGTDFAKLRANVEAVTAERDKLAHCPWVRMPNGDLKLQYTKSEWQPPGMVRGKVGRWRVPQGLIRTTEHIKGTVAQLDEAIHVVLKLRAQLESLLPESDRWPIVNRSRTQKSMSERTGEKGSQ